MVKKTHGLFSRPAITIGQLIIDERFQGKGYGKAALKFVLGISSLLKKFLPCRLLINDPYTLILDLLPINKQ